MKLTEKQRNEIACIISNEIMPITYDSLKRILDDISLILEQDDLCELKLAIERIEELEEQLIDAVRVLQKGIS